MLVVVTLPPARAWNPYQESLPGEEQLKSNSISLLYAISNRNTLSDNHGAHDVNPERGSASMSEFEKLGHPRGIEAAAPACSAAPA